MQVPEQKRIDLSCPFHLPDVARTTWEAVVDAMSVAGTLGEETLPMVERYCLVYARWREAEAMLGREGTIVRAPRTGVAMLSPWHSVARAAAAQLGKLESELGLTPLRRGGAHRAMRPLLADGSPAPRTAIEELWDVSG
jgi:P27 family predicted phage terminase small subunit